MGRQDHRARRVLRHPTAHLGAEVARGTDVEGDRRFVEEEHARIRDEAADEVHLLAHPAAQREDATVARLGQTHALEERLDARSRQTARHAVELAVHPELLAHGERAVPGVLATADPAGDLRVSAVFPPR